MSVSATCPRCTHKQRYDDDQAGSAINCRICNHRFTIGGKAKKAEAESPPAEPKKAPTPEPKSPPAKKPEPVKGTKAAEPAPKPKPTGMKSGPPPIEAVGDKGRNKNDDEDDDRPRRKSKSRDDEDDDDRPRRRSRNDNNSSTALWITLGCVGGALVLIGGGVGLYFALAEDQPPPQPNIVVQLPNINGNPGGQIQIPNPFNNPNPNPFPNQPFNPPPPPPKPRDEIDPNNPAHIDKVLAALKGDGDRNRAFDWLNRNNPAHPRRAEVAKQLDSMVDDMLKQSFVDNFFTAFYRWATLDNVVWLTRFAENPAFTVWDNARRQNGMKTLGQLKHLPAAPIIISKLGNAFDGSVARDALIAMGPGAEPALLAHLNDPDGNRRNAVNEILRSYGTKHEKLVAQSLADLKDNNDQRRGAALEWFGKAPVLEAQRTEVARAIDAYAADKGINGPVLKALETWGVAENVPRLVQQMQDNKLGSREIIQLLGKMKAPLGLTAIAGRISHFFDGAEARQALQNCGPMAEQYVVPYVVAQDRNLRIEACKLLAIIGTPKGSIPRISNAMKIYFNDRDFLQHAQNACVVIQNRAKG